jgi:ElaB/YqjD/DUF883 family membrane-anchored ribosome-binding protein
LEDRFDEYKIKPNDMKTTITEHVNKLKDNMKEVRETVVGHVKNLREKADDHVNKLVEKAKEVKGKVESEILKHAKKMNERFEELMQQYENAMARAVSMRNEAEANLKRVMEQMSNGSLVMYEKAKRLATENVEVAKGYMNKVQDVFTKQIVKLTLEVGFG